MGDDEGFITIEEVVVNGENRGRLDPVEGGGDAEIGGDIAGPLEHDGVDNAGDGAAGGGEVLEDGGEVFGSELFGLGQGGPKIGIVGVVEGGKPVGKRNEGDAVAADGGRRGREGREHPAVGGGGGGEGDVGVGGGGEALGEVESGVEVALSGKGYDEDVLLRRRHRRRFMFATAEAEEPSLG